MTESHEFDRLFRSALLDAQREDWAALWTDPLPQPDFSPGYRRWRAALLRDPFRRAKPRWQRLARAAMWLIVASAVTVGGLWLNPQTRAWMEQYILQRLEIVDEYDFYGDPGEVGDLGKLRPSYVPEGFEEVEARELSNDWHIIYENADGEIIYCYIIAAKNGSSLLFDNEHSVRTSIVVNGMKGELYTTTDPEYDNHLILSDETRHCVYYFASLLPTETLIQMAESIEEIK